MTAPTNDETGQAMPGVVRAVTCYSITCSDCQDDCWDEDDFTPLFTSKADLHTRLIKDYGWTHDRHGRWLCRRCWGWGVGSVFADTGVRSCGCLATDLCLASGELWLFHSADGLGAAVVHQGSRHDAEVVAVQVEGSVLDQFRSPFVSPGK